MQTLETSKSIYKIKVNVLKVFLFVRLKKENFCYVLPKTTIRSREDNKIISEIWLIL